MKSPVFAYGTMEALNKAVSSGKIKYPAYVWLKDTLQYAFVNKNGEIELIGLPKITGTLDKQIVLSELEGGVYAIKGQYVVASDSEPVFLSASYVLAIVRHKDDETKVRIITVDNVLDFTVGDGEITDTDQVITKRYLKEHGYITEVEVDDKITAMRVTLEEEIKDYANSIIAEQIAVLLPDELDKLLQPVEAEDVRNMFGIESI